MTVIDGLLDEVRRSGDRVVRHWKMHQGLHLYCGFSDLVPSPPHSSESHSRHRHHHHHHHHRHGKEKAAAAHGHGAQAGSGSVAEEVKEIRQFVKDALAGGGGTAGSLDPALQGRVEALEKENREVKSQLKGLTALVDTLRSELASLKIGEKGEEKSEEKEKEAEKAGDSEEDVDLFGSDEEDDEEKEKIKQQRLEAYTAKKSKKPGPIAKSSVILDVKPWDDETDMKETEKLIRGIEMDGLLWGVSKLVPVAYGIKKLQIICVIEDEKVSVDSLTEQIEEFEDYVQSVDIAAFNKI